MNEWNTYEAYEDYTEDEDKEEYFAPDPFTVYKEWKEDNM